MRPVILGVAAGLIITFFGLQFGFWGMVLAIFLGAIGGLIGAFVSGKLNFRAAVNAARGRRVG